MPRSCFCYSWTGSQGPAWLISMFNTETSELLRWLFLADVVLLASVVPDLQHALHVHYNPGVEEVGPV